MSDSTRSRKGPHPVPPDSQTAADPHDARPQYLRRSQAARFLGLATGTLANWASAGRGPTFHRVGRIPLYDHTELVRFVAAGRVEMVGA